MWGECLCTLTSVWREALEQTFSWRNQFCYVTLCYVPLSCHSKVSCCVVPWTAPGGWCWQQSAKKEETEPRLPAALHRCQAGHSACHLHSGWWEEIQQLLQQTPPWPRAVSFLCSGWPDGPRVCKWPLCIHKIRTWTAPLKLQLVELMLLGFNNVIACFKMTATLPL